MWKDFVRDYLSFSKSQRRAIYVLLVLIVLARLAPLTFSYFFPQEDSVDFEEISISFDSTENFKETPIDSTESAIKTEHLTPFDPNKIAKQDWMDLGISSKVATTIQHYRAAGGVFRQKEDLKKIYGLQEVLYQKLAPFIQIEPPNKAQPQTAQTVSKEPLQTQNKETLIPSTVSHSHKPSKAIDINRADSATWTQLSGIGPFRASKIVEYREKLGGFYAIDQVAESFGLPDSVFQDNKSFLLFTETELRKININTAPFEELIQHPYLPYELVKALLNYRKMHGSFNAVEDLKKIHLMDEETYKRVVPYLKME